MRSIYGYIFNEKTKKYDVNDDEAEVIRQIFTMYIQNFSQDDITKRLNIQKSPLPEGKFKWHTSLVNEIIRDEAYIGIELEIIKKPGAYPSIVGDSLFYKIQELANKRSGKAFDLWESRWKRQMEKRNEA